MPDFSLELDALKSCSDQSSALLETIDTPLFAIQEGAQGPFVVGVDEAGCGPWAGPVMAGAVVFHDINRVPADLLKLLDDSKKMTEKRREKAYELLQSYEGQYCYSASGQATEAEIDEINIRQGALLAMKRAVAHLPLKPYFALVDGIALPKLSCPAQAFKKGDGRSFSIAAASIIAKVTRDRLMKGLAQKYPLYLWEKNAGYGTKAHQEALAKYGVTPHHRRSFAPIARLLNASKKGP